MTFQNEKNQAKGAGRTTDEVAEFAELPRRISDQGLLERQRGYYTLKIISTAAMLTISLTVLLVVDNLWLQLGNAAFLAFVFGQIGYIGHDAGHLAICQSARGNRIIGYAASALIVVDNHA